eukprot:1866930-Amphidinium_carterae.1
MGPRKKRKFQGLVLCEHGTWVKAEICRGQIATSCGRNTSMYSRACLVMLDVVELAVLDLCAGRIADFNQ